MDFDKGFQKTQFEEIKVKSILNKQPVFLEILDLFLGGIQYMALVFHIDGIQL